MKLFEGESMAEYVLGERNNIINGISKLLDKAQMVTLL